MIRTVIESPFGRNPDGSKCTPEQYARNDRYLQRAIKHSLGLGEAPYASHWFFPGLLDDTDLAQRSLGIRAGLIWAKCAERIAVYQDHGLTEGVLLGLARHEAHGIEIVYRLIGCEPEHGICPACDGYGAHQKNCPVLLGQQDIGPE